MQIINTLSNLNYDTNIANKKETEIDKSSDLMKTQKSEFHLDIKNNFTLKTSSLHLTNKEIDEKINILNDMKTKLEKPSIEALPTYDVPLTMSIIEPPTDLDIKLMLINEYTDEELKEERDKFIPLLNPNQTFSTQGEKDSFLAQVKDLDWSVLSLEESAIYSKNFKKATSTGFDTFDKKNDFGSVIDLIYLEKKKLESSNSLLLNRIFLIDLHGLKGMDTSSNGSLNMTDRVLGSLKNAKTSDVQENADKANLALQLETLIKVEEMVLEVSQDSTALKEKESVIKEIKHLLKNVDSELAEKISGQLDTAMDKQKDELFKLTQIDIEVSSPQEAKRYLDQTEKLDVNFDDLSIEEKSVYISNKQNILNALMSTDAMVREIKQDKKTNDVEQSLSQINNELTIKLEYVIEEEKKVIKELTAKPKGGYTVHQAINFLEKAEEIEYMVSKFSDEEKLYFDMNIEEAKRTIKSNKEEAADIKRNDMIQNIDNLIYILEELKEKEEESKKNTDYKKESLSFSSQNIKQQSGNFFLSQSLMANQSNIIGLVS